MKRLTILLVLLSVLVLNFGYYKVAQENESDKIVFFLKKHLTLKVRFVNIYTVSWGEDARFTEDDQQAVIDYCKYRLGIETKLDHPDDVKRCSAR